MAGRILAFGVEHVPGAAEVLRRRHHQHRRSEPLLALEPDYGALIEQERTAGSGVVALDGDTVVGYLLGGPAEGALGPHLRCAAAGHATDDAGLVADLYAAAASGWVAQGLVRHFVFAPATRAQVAPWFELGFGASAVQAVRGLDDVAVDAEDSSVVVRRSTPSDLDDVATLARELPLALTRSPSFSEYPVASVSTLREGWRDTWEREEYTHFVAERGGALVGQLLLARPERGDLRTPPDSIDLANATTAPAQRGTGVGRALTAAALEWGRAQGFVSMTTDWRATNLPAARFWPHRGFRPTFLRLSRSIP